MDNKGAPAYAKTVIERYNERFGTNLDYEELLKESGGAEQALIDRFVVPYPQKIDISIKALQDVSPDGIAGPCLKRITSFIKRAPMNY